MVFPPLGSPATICPINGGFHEKESWVEGVTPETNDVLTAGLSINVDMSYVHLSPTRFGPNNSVIYVPCLCDNIKDEQFLQFVFPLKK